MSSAMVPRAGRVGGLDIAVTVMDVPVDVEEQG